MNVLEHKRFAVNTGKIVSYYRDKVVSTHALFACDRPNVDDEAGLYCFVRKSWSKLIPKQISDRVVVSFCPIEKDAKLVSIELYGRAVVVEGDLVCSVIDVFEKHRAELFRVLARSTKDFIRKYEIYKIILDECVQCYSFSNCTLELQPQSISAGIESGGRSLKWQTRNTSSVPAAENSGTRPPVRLLKSQIV